MRIYWWVRCHTNWRTTGLWWFCGNDGLTPRERRACARSYNAMCNQSLHGMTHDEWLAEVRDKVTPQPCPARFPGSRLVARGFGWTEDEARVHALSRAQGRKHPDGAK